MFKAYNVNCKNVQMCRILYQIMIYDLHVYGYIWNNLALNATNKDNYLIAS